MFIIISTLCACVSWCLGHFVGQGDRPHRSAAWEPVHGQRADLVLEQPAESDCFSGGRTGPVHLGHCCCHSQCFFFVLEGKSVRAWRQTGRGGGDGGERRGWRKGSAYGQGKGDGEGQGSRKSQDGGGRTVRGRGWEGEVGDQVVHMVRGKGDGEGQGSGKSWDGGGRER